jgi:hypothetical protein
MKQIILVCFLLITAFTTVRSQSLPQNTCGVVYTYDAAGNRTQRVYVCNNARKAMVAADSTLNQFNVKEVVQVSALYPNPTSGTFLIAFTQPLKQALVTFTDMQGHSLQQRVVSGTQATFDISSFPAGIYWIKIANGNKPVIYKVIKQ